MKSSNDKFHHPYEPYSIQLEFMQKLYQCIEDGHVGIFESPTGTGKSLSLISAALTWLRDHEQRTLLGDHSGDQDIDWLEQAERRIQAEQLLDSRQEVEQKLKAIRVKNSRLVNSDNPAKRVKVDTAIHENDLLLDDYESDNEGTGKGASDQILSSATLELLNQLKPVKTTDESETPRTKIIFCSRTHSQLTQFVSELRKVSITSKVSDVQDEEITKHVPLASRKTLCINPQVARLTSTTAINERCLELQKPGTAIDRKCEYLPSRASQDDLGRSETFKDNVLAQVQDIEDIASLGRKMKLCPYYASRTVISATEVVTLPYPLLLQKSAREALSVDVENNIIIIDEAHNLTSAIADTVSVAIRRSHLDLIQKQLLGYCQKFKNKLKGKNRVYIAQIIRINKSCLLSLDRAENSKSSDLIVASNDLLSGQGIDQIQPHKLVNYIQVSKLVYKIEGYAEFLEQQAQKDAWDKTTRSSQPKGVLADFQNLLIALMNPSSEGCFFITKQEGELILKYTLLDPRHQFEEIVRKARSVILAGGTMSPMSYWQDHLFSYVPNEKLKAYSFGHIIDRANVAVQCLSKGPNGIEFDFTFKHRTSPRIITELGLVVERLCMTAPDGMIVFFASYDYLAFVVKEWKMRIGTSSIFERISMLKATFTESKEASVDDLLRDYTRTIDTGKGALMLAIVGGKLSEGINFSDKLGRVVICVGLPYPNIKSAEWKAKVEYIERSTFEKCRSEGQPERMCKTRAQDAGREFTDNNTMRAVNQSIGRAIRHKNDFASIYLVDKRYSTAKIQAKLPAWLQDSLVSEDQTWSNVERNCRKFFDSG